MRPHTAVLDRALPRYATRWFRALNHEFRVHTTDPAMAGYLEELLGSFPPCDGGGSPYSLLEEVGSGSEPSFAVAVGTAPPVIFERREDALAWLLWHVHRRMVDLSTDYLLVHAGGVEAGGRAIVLPGPSGAGKTTLVAGLVEAGLRYLSDEVVGFQGSPALAHPCPKPLSLKAGAQLVFPQLRPRGPAAGDEWQVRVSSIRADALAPSCRPAFVVVPHYQAGGPTRLPLARADALVVLAENCFNLAGSAGLALLAEVVREARCYRLLHADLDDARRLVLGLLER